MFLLFFSTCTATKIMLTMEQIDIDDRSVTLGWTVDRFRPETFRLKIICKYMCSDAEQHIYKDKVLLFNSQTEGCTVNELAPGSRCIVRFHAVYNPATLDDGVFFMFTTGKIGKT